MSARCAKKIKGEEKNAIRNDIRMRTVEMHSAAFAESVSGNGIANTNETRFECRLLFLQPMTGFDRDHYVSTSEFQLQYCNAFASIRFNWFESNRMDLSE